MPKVIWKVQSAPTGLMVRGSEYYGSGLYFIADEKGEDVMGDGCWFFHPLFDQDKNAGGGCYVVEDVAAWQTKQRGEIERRGKAFFVKEIERLETFLAKVLRNHKVTGGAQ